MTAAVASFRHKIWRVIPSRFPPVHIFEAVADAEDFDALYALEMLTNPRLRNEAGKITLVPLEDRVYGNGAGYIMAAFTHLNPEGSRFSDGSYGVFYAALCEETAVRETVFHRKIFLSRTAEAPQEFDMRVLCAALDADLHDIAGRREEFKKLHAPDDYVHSQAFGRRLREQGSYGIAYDSVRDGNGVCFAVFRPKALSDCVQAWHLSYVWNGEDIVDVYEKTLDA